MNAKTAWRWALQAGFSLLLLGGVLWWTGPRALLEALHEADPRWLAAAAVAFLGTTVMHGVRWWVLLRPVGRVPLWPTVLVMMVAKAVGVLLPLRAGAVLQVQLLGRRYDFNRAAVAGTLVLEGVIDAACFLIVFLIAAPFIGGNRYITDGIWLMAVVVIVALTAIFLIARRRPASKDEMTGKSLTARVNRGVEAVRQGFHAVRSPLAVTLALLCTLGDWALATVGYALAGRAFGFHLDLSDYVQVEIVSNLAGAIPFTQSGIGPYEVAVTSLLSAHGIDSDAAGAYAIGVHALILLVSLVAGGLALLPLHLRLNEVFYLRREPEAEAGAPSGAAT
jgi:uncharacterized protein (TIRG00374 family)